MASASVNMHGQITLPVDMRKKMDLTTGSLLCVDYRDNEIILKKARVVEEDVIKELEQLAKSKHITKDEIVEACRKIRKQLYKTEYDE